MEDTPEFFRCDVCNDYRPVEELVEVSVRDLLFKRQMCKKCVKGIQEGGANAGPKKKEEDSKERKPGIDKVWDTY